MAAFVNAEWTGRMMTTLTRRVHRADRYSDEYLARCAAALAYLVTRNRRGVPPDLRWW